MHMMGHRFVFAQLTATQNLTYIMCLYEKVHFWHLCPMLADIAHSDIGTFEQWYEHINTMYVHMCIHEYICMCTDVRMQMTAHVCRIREHYSERRHVRLRSVTLLLSRYVIIFFISE